jgi:hypothetical protein
MKWHKFPEEIPPHDMDCVVVDWQGSVYRQRWYSEARAWGCMRPAAVVWWAPLKDVPEVTAEETNERRKFLDMHEDEEEREFFKAHPLQIAKEKTKKRGPIFHKRTLEKVDEVCYQYHLTSKNMTQISRSTGLSPQTIDRVLDHFGAKYRKENAKAIADYRGLPDPEAIIGQGTLPAREPTEE